MKLEIFDPPMCCASGVCGADIDPVLPRFAADLEWLKTQGVAVTRYNLAQEPAVFVAHPAVGAVLQQEGNACLPLIVVNNGIVSRAVYPEKAVLAAYLGFALPPRSLASLPIQPCCAAGGESEASCC